MRGVYQKDKRKYAELNQESKYLLDPKYMTKRDMQHYYRYYNLTKNRSQFKKIILLVLFICFFSYILVDYNIKTKLISLKDRFDILPHVFEEYNLSQAYFVDTPGCRMPFFNVTDDNIIQFMYKPLNYTCKKPMTRTSDIGAQLWLNMDEAELQEHYNVSDMEGIRCHYQEIRRKTDQQNQYLQVIPFRWEPNRTVQIKPGIEFLRVECYDSELRTFYKDYHFFALDKSAWQHVNETVAFIPNSVDVGPKFERVSFNKATDRERQFSYKTNTPPTSEPVDRVSVMVLGIDSVSHLNFLRQMRHTAAYIHHKLTHTELWGYNKVGDNTYPNLMPMLSGLDEIELNISCLASVKQANYDKCAFIWKRYKDAGFRTVYAEDVATLGLFNFFRPGFRRQPTDYYLRPIMLEMEQHIGYKQSVNVELCKGGRRTVDVVLELIRKLIPYLQTQDFFSFFWTVTLTHDLLNMPMLLDHDLVRLFEAFDTAGIFNKTVIFLASDHGLRWGSFRKTYQGMMEERQPLLVALYPRWFKEKYATAVANLEINARRLTTHYDLHATMLDLLDLRNIRAARLAERTVDLAETETMPRGISLFLPVPESRTCEQAGIASHWCTCHQRTELQTNDSRVQRAARYIVKLINDRLKASPQCRMLYLNAILMSIVAAPHHKIVKNVTNDFGIDITVRVQTKPGLATFESTVRISSYSTALTGTISRLNLYAGQSYCIDDYALKMFCYCHR